MYGYLVGSIHDACFVCPADVVAASEAIRVLQMIFLRSGGLFAKGGIGRVAETFAAAVEENGGKYVTKARVQKILVENGAVTGVATDEGTFHAPIVVSNAGIQPTVLEARGRGALRRALRRLREELWFRPGACPASATSSTRR